MCGRRGGAIWRVEVGYIPVVGRGKEAVKVGESVDRSKGVQGDVRRKRGVVEGPGKQWR